MMWRPFKWNDRRKILPWVADSSDNSYPIWEIFGATQRSTYF